MAKLPFWTPLRVRIGAVTGSLNVAVMVTLWLPRTMKSVAAAPSRPVSATLGAVLSMVTGTPDVTALAVVGFPAASVAVIEKVIGPSLPAGTGYVAV